MVSGAGLTICVVDDDEVVRDSLKALLESRRFNVVDFGSGSQFLDGRKDAAGACLLLDMHMHELSGLDVLKALRDMGDLIPIIMLTGRSDSLLESRARLLGAIAVLDKPIAHSALFAAIDLALAAGQG